MSGPSTPSEHRIAQERLVENFLVRERAEAEARREFQRQWDATRVQLEAAAEAAAEAVSCDLSWLPRVAPWPSEVGETASSGPVVEGTPQDSEARGDVPGLPSEECPSLPTAVDVWSTEQVAHFLNGILPGHECLAKFTYTSGYTLCSLDRHDLRRQACDEEAGNVIWAELQHIKSRARCRSRGRRRGRSRSPQLQRTRLRGIVALIEREFGPAFVAGGFIRDTAGTGCWWSPIENFKGINEGDRVSFCLDRSTATAVTLEAKTDLNAFHARYFARTRPDRIEAARRAAGV